MNICFLVYLARLGNKSSRRNLCLFIVHIQLDKVYAQLNSLHCDGQDQSPPHVLVVLHAINQIGRASAVWLWQISRIQSFKLHNPPTVKSANIAFIFMINLLIIQGCQSGSVGRGGQSVRLVWRSRWSR